jgi:hypothetical protein
MLVAGLYFLEYNVLKMRINAQKGKLQQLEGILKGPQAAPPTLPAGVLKELGFTGKEDRFIKILGAIHRNIPNDVYFQSLIYDRKLDQLLLKGVAVKDSGKTNLPRFIEKMKGKEYFKSLELSNLQASKAYTIPAYDFEIKCVLSGVRQ